MSDHDRGAHGLGFLSGGGELGALIRAHDWTNSPIGSPSAWPQSLRLAIRIMLTSGQPFWIGWGPDLTYFYNDPYKSIIGGKHPWALGRPTAEVWREIWDDIAPLLATATSGEQGTFVESQLLIMERHGYQEETYYTFSYSPIPNDDGTVGGIICANSDDTQRVIGERQLALLRALAAETSTARSWQEACEKSAVGLGTNTRDLPFAMLYMAEPGSRTLSLVGTSGIDPGHVGAPLTLQSDAMSPWPVDSILRDHELRLVTDLQNIFPEALPRGPWPDAPSTAAILPVVPGTEGGRNGILVVGLNRYRLFDHNYRGFLGLVAGQIASAIANAQSYEEERRRAEILSELDRAKTAFFSNVSHEFRTPLTLLLGPLDDALRDPTLGTMPQAQQDRLRTVQRNALRLLKLVNSLLDFARIEAGRVDASFEPTDLAKLTASLASNFESAMQRANLRLVIDCKPLGRPVYIDHDMWEKIVLNLLSNAFKFTFEGSVTVTLQPTPDNLSVELLVRDTGVGIRESELPRLFERFHRVEGQKSRSFEGSGIGLALVQELVRQHGGDVQVESDEGNGTTFRITLPFGSSHLPQDRIGAERNRVSTSMRASAIADEASRWLPSASGETIPPDDAGSAQGFERDTFNARVLVADDNPDMRDYIARLLGQNWQVEMAGDGVVALECARKNRPDLLLTDVMMPRLDGFGLLREIRNDPALHDLPVIMLTARAGEEARVEGLDHGADDYLVKPFAAKELVARVGAHLALSRLRRQATQAALDSAERLQQMFEQAPGFMCMLRGPEHVFELANAAYQRLVQRDVIGKSIREAFPELREQGFFELLDEVYATGRPFVGSAQRLTLGPDDNRQEHFLDFIYQPIRDADNNIVGLFVEGSDVTERVRAENALREINEQLETRVAERTAEVSEALTRLNAEMVERHQAEEALRQAQKMEAVGKLTGGVAHDFNNVLQVIGGNLQLLTKDVSGNTRAEQRVQTALIGVSRGSKLASQLLAFGRRQPLAPRVVNLGRLLRGVDDMLRRAIGESIDLETVISGGLWNTFVDTAQVENALLNLAINARDAMKGEGRLTIEVGNAWLDDDYAARHADVSPGQYVMVAVTDTGCGIEAAILDQVFEPFFTTKPEGQGTGLGLSMVYGFVKQSGGHIKIYSEVDHGTTVRMYLPRARQREDIETETEAGPVTGGSETILVVEDDEDVRGTVVSMLSDLGYRVLKARDAQSALSIIESGIPIDLLFTDVVMPGPLRSPEMARKARERIPDMAVLFTSGYTENAIVHDGKLDAGIDLLSKPYTREALARKIRHALRNREQIRMNRERHAAGANGSAANRLNVLVVEDDPIIRMVAVEMLQDMGHAVLEAADATDALALIGRNVIDVLLTDESMPGMSGSELYRRAVELEPLLRAIFASGKAPDEFSDDLRSRAAFLLKPYDEQRLAQALREVASGVTG